MNNQYSAHRLLAKNMQSCWSFDLRSTVMELAKKTRSKGKWTKRKSSKLEGKEKGTKLIFSTLGFHHCPAKFSSKIYGVTRDLEPIHDSKWRCGS